MPKISNKELEKFMKETPDSHATQAVKEQLEETPVPDPTTGDHSELSVGSAQIIPVSTSQGGDVDYDKPMSIIERNRGKQDFVLMEHDVVEANTRLIAQLHDEVHECMRIGLEKAIQIGKLLNEQKKRIKHGKFTRWAAEFLPFTVRTAQSYMKLYIYKDSLLNSGVTSLSEAYAALKGEATPDEVIDADDSVNTDPKWEIKEASVDLDKKMLPKKKAKGVVKELAINQEVVARIREQEYPFEDSRGKCLKIIVGVPRSDKYDKELIGDFVLEASRLLKPGGKLIFHKK